MDEQSRVSFAIDIISFARLHQFTYLSFLSIKLKYSHIKTTFNVSVVNITDLYIINPSLIDIRVLNKIILIISVEV